MISSSLLVAIQCRSRLFFEGMLSGWRVLQLVIVIMLIRAMERFPVNVDDCLPPPGGRFWCNLPVHTAGAHALSYPPSRSRPSIDKRSGVTVLHSPSSSLL